MNDSVTLLAVGDHGIANDQFKRVSAAMNKINNKIVLLLGDNFYENGVTDVDDKKWKEVFLDLFTPNKMYLPVLGNHDYIFNPNAQLEFRKGGWYFPAKFYRTELNDPLLGLVSLDTVLLCPVTSAILGVPLSFRRSTVNEWGIVEKQFAMLERFKWKIVVGHYPVFSDGSHGDNFELIEKLQPLLKKHKINVYLSAHEHNFQHKIVEGIHYIICGNGSRKDFKRRINSPETLFFTALGGFLMLSVHDNRIEGTFIDEFEKPLYSFTITAS